MAAARKQLILFMALGAALAAIVARAADQYELAPIEYSASTPDNPVAALQRALEERKVTLPRETRTGYLRGLLAQLKIPVDSQLLVFSKTSMQRDRISPRTPRAIYFNDEVYVGYCHAGDVIEVAAADPQLGAVFYTLGQQNHEHAALERQTHSCLQCHGTTQTDDIPGFVVRSVFTGASGLPILSEGSHRVDQTTPIEDRWGGWYVTGTHGEQPHLGNLVVRDREAPRPWRNEEGQNVTQLDDKLRTENYLAPHSDIVALMVFEHQTHVHNLITKANFAARQALLYETELNQAFGEPAGNRLESTTRRIANAGEKLVEGLLFSGEAPIKGPIAGTSAFSEEFMALGRRDSRKRSLRDLDLSTRMFKYPCSYLIYSPSFDGLPAEMKNYVARRLREVIAGDGGEAYWHLTAADRRHIGEILRETKPELWNLQ